MCIGALNKKDINLKKKTTYSKINHKDYKMKISQSELKKIIKEELERAVSEQSLQQEQNDKIEKLKNAINQFGEMLKGIGMDTLDLLVPQAAGLASDNPQLQAKAMADLSKLISSNPDAGLFEGEQEAGKAQIPQDGYKDDPKREKERDRSTERSYEGPEEEDL